ncbi:MAG: hypothetical protein R6V01_02170 [Thermoplasmatota archaeon]
MAKENGSKENREEGPGRAESKNGEPNKMSSFARSFVMPYEKIIFYKDLRTFTQKYLAMIFSIVITLFAVGIFIVVGASVEDDGGIFFGIAAVCFVVGAIVTIIIMLMRSVPELTITDMRIIFCSGRKGNQLMEECPHDKLSGFQARRVRRILPIVIGILMILGGMFFIPLGIGNMESETESVEVSPGQWEEQEVEPNTLDYMGPFVFGSFLIIMGILILIFLGFMFNYVFKMSGGNITVPCTGRKNRENATLINSILMNIRRQG